ncbi:RNA 2',3'-cyclic phosphodiesterase [Shewanella sp. UCD-KL12]|uniref:RNA 2',3'-cyclic phosphodiesterase n=1 Tax=Shewanella sp. UCD-KL12 TaxID=1917163 RepID=UPI00097077F2|nr:RNA 2',3'-cyclic phosphodiesterase [Shewanella sp. UCD-KL12]
MKRLFIGVSLENEQVDKLESFQSKVSKECGLETARPVCTDNFHMTLSFIGGVSTPAVSHLVNALDEVSNATGWPKFDVTFNRLTFWQKPQVICLSAAPLSQSTINPALALTLARCYTISRNLDLFPEKSSKTGVADKHHDASGFTPHVTLFHKAKLAKNNCLTQITPPHISLQPTQLHLYQSISGPDGVKYPKLHSWALR